MISLMPFIYPMLAALALVFSILLFLTWLWVERRGVLLLLAIYIFLEACALALLTIANGRHPGLSIAVLRPYIAVVRLIALIVVIPCVILQFQRLGEAKRK